MGNGISRPSKPQRYRGDHLWHRFLPSLGMIGFESLEILGRLIPVANLGKDNESGHGLGCNVSNRGRCTNTLFPCPAYLQFPALGSKLPPS